MVTAAVAPEGNFKVVATTKKIEDGTRMYFIIIMCRRRRRKHKK